MLTLIPILATAITTANHHDYKVVSVERTEAYAGKLGRRVHQTLLVERDGKRYSITLGRSHTAIARSTKSYSAGDTVRPDWGSIIREAN